MYAPSPSAMTRRIRSDLAPRIMNAPLPSLPPDTNAVGKQEPGNNEHRQPEDALALILRQHEPAVVWIARPNRDQIFLLREPVAHVQEEVLVAGEAKRAIGREVAVADPDEARFRLRSGWRARSGSRGITSRGGRRRHEADGTGDVAFLRFHLGPSGFVESLEIRLGPRLFPCLDDFLRELALGAALKWDDRS